MSVVIKLAPIETLGRKMQYAFLSYALHKHIRVEANYLANEVRIDEDDFQDLVKEVRDVILKVILKKEEEVVTVMGGGDICSFKFDEGPILYSAGMQDKNILSKLGLTMCQPAGTANEGEEGKGKKKKESISWTRAALSYANMVINNSRTVEGNEEVPLIQLATVTLFSEKNVRTPINFKKKRDVDITVNFDGLGVLLLGGLLSYLGRYSLQLSQRQKRSEEGEKESQEYYEFLLLPDSPNKAFINLRNFAITTSNNNIAYIVQWLVTNLSGISFEVALSIAIATKLANEAKTADFLESEGSIFSSKLYLVLPQVLPLKSREKTYSRPMLLEATPLDLTIAKTYSNDTIKYINEIAKKVVSSPKQDYDKQQAISAVSDCINYMSLQTMSPCNSEFLAMCLRELEQIDTEKFDIEYLLRKFKVSLYKDYEKMVEQCH